MEAGRDENWIEVLQLDRSAKACWHFSHFSLSLSLSLSSLFNPSLPQNKRGGNMLNKILACVVDGATWFRVYARTHTDTEQSVGLRCVTVSYTLSGSETRT